MTPDAKDKIPNYSVSFSGFLVLETSWAWTLSQLDPSSPLERIISDIEKSIAAKLYYPALLVTLTLPEICMGLMLPRSKFVKQPHYVDFIDRYTKASNLGLDGAGCYQLRGGLVHRADLRGHAYFEGTHVVFTVPESQGFIHSLSVQVGDKIALMFDLEIFCAAMISAARNWFDVHKDDPQVLENLKNLIRWCPEGLSPFVGGTPVVASGA
jgi:hypothetical protein